MTTPTPYICATSVKGIYQGEAFVNVFHFMRNDQADMTTTDLAAIHGILDDASTDNDALLHMYASLDSGLNISQLYSRTITPSAPVELASSVNLSGTSGGADILPMTALYVKWSTLIADRRHRGRSFFTGLNSGMWQTADTDYLDTTFAATFQTKVNEFVAAWDANATYDFIVYSRAEADDNVLFPYSPIAGGAVQSRLGLQRRRSPGR